jgi:hypothetical protein
MCLTVRIAMSKEPFVEAAKFGRIPEFDPLSLNFPARSLIEASDIFTKTWRRQPAYDQGNTPKCVGYSVYGLVNCQPWTKSISYSRRSRYQPDEIYRWAKRHDAWPGTQYAGTSVNAGLKCLRRNGIISEYRWCASVPDILSILSSHGPVVLGVNWYNSMFFQEDFDPGYVPYQLRVDQGSGVAGGHAVTLHGVDTKTRTVIGTNSWGQGWGDEGRFYLGWDDLEYLLSDNGEAATIVA